MINPSRHFVYLRFSQNPHPSTEIGNPLELAQSSDAEDLFGAPEALASFHRSIIAAHIASEQLNRARVALTKPGMPLLKLQVKSRIAARNKARRARKLGKK